MIWCIENFRITRDLNLCNSYSYFFIKIDSLAYNIGFTECIMSETLTYIHKLEQFQTMFHFPDKFLSYHH